MNLKPNSSKIVQRTSLHQEFCKLYFLRENFEAPQRTHYLEKDMMPNGNKAFQVIQSA